MLGIVGADSLSAAGLCQRQPCTGAYRMRPYGCFVREGVLFFNLERNLPAFDRGYHFSVQQCAVVGAVLALAVQLVGVDLVHVVKVHQHDVAS